jgi:hypothetical protein
VEKELAFRVAPIGALSWQRFGSSDPSPTCMRRGGTRISS